MATVRFDRRQLEAGHLPGLCLHCGGPAEVWCDVRFRTGAGGGWLFVPGLMIWVGNPTPARVPLCRAHRDLFKRPLRVYLGTMLLLLATLALLAIVLSCLGPRWPVVALVLGPLLGLGAFTVAFGGLFWVQRLRTRLPRCTATTPYTVTLTNVAEAFADRLAGPSWAGSADAEGEPLEEVANVRAAPPRSRLALPAAFLGGGLLAFLALGSVLFLSCGGLLILGGFLLPKFTPSPAAGPGPGVAAQPGQAAPRPAQPARPGPDPGRLAPPGKFVADPPRTAQPAKAGPKERPLDPALEDRQLNKVYLSDLQEQDARVGWGRFGKNGMLGYGIAPGEQDHPVTVAGKRYPHALSMVPGTGTYSAVKYRLGKRARVLRAFVAVNDLENDATGPRTAITFEVLGDGKLLWQSKPLQAVARTEECVVKVAGVEALELRVQCPGDFYNARAVWLDPLILK
jgi:hypothetical protein